MEKFPILFTILSLIVIAPLTTTPASAQIPGLNLTNSVPQAADQPTTQQLAPQGLSMQMSTSTTTGDINSQIAALQKQIQQLNQTKSQLAQKVAMERKDTLTTVGFVKPNLSATAYDKLKTCNPDQKMPEINSVQYVSWWKTYLTDFRCGHVTHVFKNNNTAQREFTLIADDGNGMGHNIPITKNTTDPVMFPAWTFNHTVPGPTMRMTQGDHVKITVINSNESKFPHSFHTHSIHSGANDGMTGPGGAIAPGHSFTYEFIAKGGAAGGVYPYHCHMEPIQTHIIRGLYGMMIIDSPTPRPQMKELVMLLNGYSFNKINVNTLQSEGDQMLVPPTMSQLRIATADVGTWKDNNNKADDKAAATPQAAADDNNANANDNNNNNSQAEDDKDPNAAIKAEALSPGGGEEGQDNQFYTVNGVAFAYTGADMIHLIANQNYRIYLVNMVEFDPVNSFHLHGNMFVYYPSGTSMKPSFVNDIITLGQGDRGIIETRLYLPGDFMVHAHVNRFSNLGWLAMLHVTH